MNAGERFALLHRGLRGANGFAVSRHRQDADRLVRESMEWFATIEQALKAITMIGGTE